MGRKYDGYCTKCEKLVDGSRIHDIDLGKDTFPGHYTDQWSCGECGTVLVLVCEIESRDDLPAHTCLICAETEDLSVGLGLQLNEHNICIECREEHEEQPTTHDIYNANRLVKALNNLGYSPKQVSDIINSNPRAMHGSSH